MEFHDIGKLCAYPLCNQKDFLPFTCEACQKPFCLAHRSYLTHDCEAAKSRDITSVECPICKKSVRMMRSEDANVVWDRHYMTECQQQPPSSSASSSQRQTCCRSGCNTVLGSSNSIQCLKCHKRVCISHRMAEDHQCSSLSAPKSSFLSSFESRSTKSATANSAKSHSSQSNSNKTLTNSRKQQQNVDVSNSVRGTVARRMVPPPTGSTPSPASVSASNSAYSCPFCSQSMANMDDLQSHIAIQHDDSTSSSMSVASSSEICPICQARFMNTNQLISHVEQTHQQYSNSPAAPVSPRSQGDSCRIT